MKVYFTVGPSQIYPTIPKYLNTALKEDVLSMNHRGPAFEALFKETVANLKKLLGVPKTSQIFFISSALEGMERTIQNCIYKQSFHVITGSFSEKFYQTALDYNKIAGKLDVPKNEGIDLTKLKVPKDAEVICLTENETSTGVELKAEDIIALKNNYPNKLIAIDIVSSVPFPKLDFSKIDVAIFSVQKGFGLPAGLGVLVVSDQALKKSEEIKKYGVSIGSYHSFESLMNMAEKGQTPATPNVLNIYLLNKVIKDLLKKGIKKVRQEIELRSQLIYQAFDERTDLTPTVKQPEYRSKTTIIINTYGKTKEIVEKLAKKGFIVSKGYGVNKEDQIRIANFPAHKVSHVKILLKNI